MSTGQKASTRKRTIPVFVPGSPGPIFSTHQNIFCTKTKATFNQTEQTESFNSQMHNASNELLNCNSTNESCTEKSATRLPCFKNFHPEFRTQIQLEFLGGNKHQLFWHFEGAQNVCCFNSSRIGQYMQKNRTFPHNCVAECYPLPTQHFLFRKTYAVTSFAASSKFGQKVSHCHKEIQIHPQLRTPNKKDAPRKLAVPCSCIAGPPTAPQPTWHLADKISAAFGSQEICRCSQNSKGGVQQLYLCSPPPMFIIWLEIEHCQVSWQAKSHSSICLTGNFWPNSENAPTPVNRHTNIL